MSEPNLYLILDHGRRGVQSMSNEQGAAGPTLGPIESFFATYNVFRVLSEDTPTQIHRYDDGCLFYDGMLWGRWEILSVDKFRDPSDPSLQRFDPEKACAPVEMLIEADIVARLFSSHLAYPEDEEVRFFTEDILDMAARTVGASPFMSVIYDYTQFDADFWCAAEEDGFIKLCKEVQNG